MKLAKMGYYGGDPDKVAEAPVDTVLNILRYLCFENDLDEAYRKIMEEDK